MSGVVVDTSAWIEFFAGRPARAVDDALAHGTVVVAPLVAAELLSGARRPADRAAIAALVQELPVHDTSVAHWMRVGDLRRSLRDRGLTVSTPDAHVAQCALDRDAVLVSRDAIFARIARLTKLRLSAG